MLYGISEKQCIVNSIHCIGVFLGQIPMSAKKIYSSRGFAFQNWECHQVSRRSAFEIPDSTWCSVHLECIYPPLKLVFVLDLGVAEMEEV